MSVVIDDQHPTFVSIGTEPVTATNLQLRNIGGTQPVSASNVRQRQFVFS